MQIEQLPPSARLTVGGLALVVAVAFISVSAYDFFGKSGTTQTKSTITLSPKDAMPNPFAEMFAAKPKNILGAELIKIRGNDGTLPHVYYGDFNGTDIEKITANAISLMRMPDNAATVPTKIAIDTPDASGRPPDYFGYRYTQSLIERERTFSDLPLKYRFPGEFYYSSLAYLRHKDMFDSFAQKNNIVWFLDRDILQKPGRVFMVVPGDEDKGLTMRARNFPQVCGDGAITGSEQCDDASTANGDGCNATCGVESTWACNGQPSHCYQPSTCGNSVVEPSEHCDNGRQCSDGKTTCTKDSDCTGMETGDKLCAPRGNDGCSSRCKKEICGDGEVQPALGEQCDPNAPDTSVVCQWDCTLVVPL